MRTLAFGILFFACLSAFANKSFAQRFSLGVTASPATYSAVGDVITVTYTITNSGLTNGFIGFADDSRVTPINCVNGPTIVPGTNTCTGTYTITQADITFGSVMNNAEFSVACGDCAFESLLASALTTFVAPPPPPATASIRIIQRAIGGNGSFSFTATLGAFSLTTVNGEASTSFLNLAPGAYVVTQSGQPANWLLSSLTCTGDTGGAPVTVDPASGTANIGLDGGEDITCVFENTLNQTPPPPAGTASIRIIQRAIGGNGSFSFTATLGAFSLTTVNGEASTSFPNLAPGAYTVTQSGQPANWLLSSLTCTGDAGGAPVTVEQTGGVASIGLDGGEAIVCVFENVFDQAGHQIITQTGISRFLSQRAGFLVTEGPDRPRILRREPNYGWQQQQQPPAGGTFGFTGPADGTGSRLMFAASMNDMAAGVPAAPASVSNAIHDRMFGYVSQGPSQPGVEALAASTNESAPAFEPSGFDIWVEAHRVLFESNLGGAAGEGSFSVVYLGADYLVTQDLLFGALVQFDWMDQDVASLNQTVSGYGYMAGPYVSMRLAESLFFDARVAWGESDNSISPTGLYTDRFGTERFLAHAKLSGNWNPVADLRVTPGVSFDYVEENQRSYVDTLGVLIGSQSISFGEVRFGPEIARLFIGDNGTAYEPFVNLTGAWRFDMSEAQTAGGAALREGFSGRVEAGILVRAVSGTSVRVAASADGIGNSAYEAYGIQGWLNIPIR